jgi:hypothetical protein
MIVNDLIEAIFESMPMLVIQFINNFMTNSWSNLFVISSFLASVAMVIINSLKLVVSLYSLKINPIIELIRYLENNL